MPGLTREQFDAHRRNLRRLFQKGATDEQVSTYLSANSLSAEDLRTPPDYVGIPKPVLPVRRPDVVVDPNAARMAGGLVGGTLGVPLGPAGALGGGVLGAETAGQLAEVFNTQVLGARDDRSALERMGASATNMTVDTALSGGLPVASRALRGVGGALIETGRKRAAGHTARQALSDLEQAGVPLEGAVGAVSGNRNVQGAQEALRRLPGSANVIDKAVTRTREGVSDFAERIASSSGAVRERFTAGENIQSGLNSYFQRRAREIGDMYAQVRGLDQLRVDFQPAKALAAEVLQTQQQGLGDSQTIRIAQRIVDRLDNIDFATARKLRSDLARVSRGAGEGIKGEAEAASARLAEVIDDSMEAAGSKLSPTEFDAFRKANTEWRRFRETRDFLENIAESPTAEQAFNRALAGANDGPTRLLALKESIDPKLWDDFVSYKIRDMGLETAGSGTEAVREFSPTTFLTNWRKLPPESKDVLFGKAGRLRLELDRLARISGNIKDVRALANLSETSTSFRFQEMATGGLGGAGGALLFTGHPLMAALAVGGPVGAAYGSAKLMTNPRFVRWLANGTRINPINTNGLAAHIGRLIAIAKAEPEIRQEIQSYLDSFGQ